MDRRKSDKYTIESIDCIKLFATIMVITIMVIAAIM